MKYLVLASTITLFVLLLNSCAGTSQTTTAENALSRPAASTISVQPIIPTTESMSPNTGIIEGHISYFDGTPASQMDVWFFRQGEDSSDKHVYTNDNGDYTFSVAPDTYEIYTATFRHGSPIGFVKVYTYEDLLPPDATITVNDQQTITVPTIMVPREISQIFYDSPTFGSPVDITDPSADVIVPSTSSTFSWESVPGAVTYSVLFQPLNSQPANYDDSITVTSTTISAPTLQICNYQFNLMAFDNQGHRVGDGMGWFTVK